LETNCTNNGEWTPDARHQISAERERRKEQRISLRETTDWEKKHGMGEPPRMHKFVANYTNGEENIFLH
jgi:hypothetical protein